MRRQPTAPKPGERIDFAPFARVQYFYGDDPRARRFVDAETSGGAYLASEPDEAGRRHIGISWEDPRDVYSVAVTLDGSAEIPPEKIEVQYWRRKWPFRDRDVLRGAARGWIGRDDHYRGEWVTAIADASVKGSRILYTFHHLDISEVRELENAEALNARYRCAVKFRLLFPEGASPKVKRIEALGAGEWKQGEADVFGVGECDVEAFNGWVLSRSAKGDALNVKYLYIPVPADDFPHRRTVITVRDADHPFSFCASDLETRPLFVEDYGIVVRPAGDKREPESIADELVSMGVPSIYDRVFDEPEQTFERAMAEIPPLRPPYQHAPRGRYCPLGCEGSRQRFALRYNGSFFVDKRANKSVGRDTVGLIWPGAAMELKFATGDFADFRERESSTEQRWSEDGAPVITTTWIDRDVEYTQTAFAAYLREDIGDYFGKRGDEDIVLLAQFEIRNIAHDRRRAHLWLRTEPFECLQYENSVLSAHGRLVKTEQLQSDELASRVDVQNPPNSFNWVVREYDEPLARARVDLGAGCGFTTPLALDKEQPAGVPTAFHYWVDLEGGARDVVTFVVPYCALSGSGLRELGGVDYNAKLREVRGFWTPFVDSGMKLSIPDKAIETFFRKVPVHVAITATKDPGSGEYIVPAATFSYGACGNEACIQIRQLDYRGHHKQAEKYLDGLLSQQGAFLLDGNFQSKDGVLQGIDFYDGKPLRQPFAYNTDHGFVLWTLAEHYFLTRDKKWLRRVADKLIAACDFITREREATKIDGSPQYGLLPAGHLEDNDEWRYWFAVNAHAYLGIAWTALALQEIEHREAAWLEEEAESYRADILAAVERAMVESPVATLPDRTSIPHIPARTEIRGPDWGWFREGAYGALHLVDGRLLDPNDERVTWTMKYLEDLIYPSRSFGRPIDLERRWFSQAGVTIQANLLNNGVAYVQRDEPKHAVRAMYNDFAASIYRDVLIFTEHPVVQLSRGVGPYYKTPDECGFLNTLRMCLVQEDGDTLYLAKAAPVSWFKPGEKIEVTDAATYFGPVSYSITVKPDSVEATIKPPRRNPPGRIALRLRRDDGRPIKKVTVGGKKANWDAERELVWLEPTGGPIRLTAVS